jgi:glucose dehydrogenase
VVATVTQAQSLNDWSSVAKDPGGSKFSPLTQITPANVSQLQTAWTYDLGMGGPYTVTPIVISNILYFPVGPTSSRCRPTRGRNSGSRIS